MAGLYPPHRFDLSERSAGAIVTEGSTPSGSVVMKKWIALALAATALTLSACNTIRGVGRDVGAAGDAIEDAAN